MNPEYAATVVRMPETRPLEGCDHVVGATFFGFQSIVSKDAVPGELGIVFTAETKLSDEFLRMNNLYRHAEKNSDPTKTGYFEDNGRVRAMKFRGHRSDAFFMPISSLNYIPAKIQDPDDPLDLHEGYQFDELDGHKICEKYIPRGTKSPGTQQTKKVLRVSDKVFPQHVDTANFFRMYDNLSGQGYVTQKLHGTSVRIGNVRVPRNLRWYEKVAQFLGVRVQTHEYEGVAGSRRVTKDPAKGGFNYYDSDIHSQVAMEVLDMGVVPEGVVLYGEIIGWTTSGAPIQKGYTYQLPVGQHDLYIYRVVFISPEGIQIELPWEQVKVFCKERGLNHVPEMTDGAFDPWVVKETWSMAWEDQRFAGKAGFDPVPTEGKTPDEGVVYRMESGGDTKFYKLKSPAFLRHETKMLDSDEVDMESMEVGI